ncbi:hypothetical protein TNCV_2468871 [Trichonephila clavipes]|nr:hypothetical protein TNCV_2468871 [Trichonephila clavipes]
MPKRIRGLKTDEIQKVLADLEDEIFDDSDSDCELENEEDDLISAQQKVKTWSLKGLETGKPSLISDPRNSRNFVGYSGRSSIARTMAGAYSKNLGA